MQRGDWMSDEARRSGVDAERRGSPGLDWGLRMLTPIEESPGVV